MGKRCIFMAKKVSVVIDLVSLITGFSAVSFSERSSFAYLILPQAVNGKIGPVKADRPRKER